MAPERGRRPPIALTLVAGPTGTGKTSLVNRLLRDPTCARTAVIQNDIGRAALAGAAAETVEDGFVSLGGGCVCCTVRGELIAALERLLRAIDNRRLDPVDRLLLEVGGEADPAAILAGIVRHPYLSLRFRADGVVATALTGSVADVLTAGGVAARQVAMADLVVLAGEAGEDRTADGAIAAPVRTLEAVTAAEVVGRPFWRGAFADDETGPDRGDGRFVRADVSGAGASPAEMEAITADLAAAFGPALVKLLAIGTKAGVRTTARGLGGVLFPVAVAEGVGEPDGGRIAMTVEGVGIGAVTSRLEGLLSTAGVDRPDRTALVDNPLAVAGFSARPGRR